jgi:enoyl-CoA hydratase
MIVLDINDHVATATLDQAPVNAINLSWMERFSRILDEVEADCNISVLHIRSEVKVFCAGADLEVMRKLLPTPSGRDEMIEIVRRMQDVFLRLERMGAVTVAEIGGAALGGGLELALACDLRVASEDARLGFPEPRLGLLPGAGGTQRLPRLCGEAVARRLILGAEVVDGRTAQQLGVVHWVQSKENLAERTRVLVQSLAESTPQALSACKRCIEAFCDPLQNGYERELTETRQLHDVPETQERLNAILSKKR